MVCCFFGRVFWWLKVDLDGFGGLGDVANQNCKEACLRY